ncbi:hypothetical protein BDV93DRAFT_478274 [Ceratobasidium sp. AG-I]|nr:hypothetical protein BDV93DRAFT_478274 [Ceratobasidium sp. AG-I]
MPYNVTIDDLSPLITYKGQWDDSYKSGDPYTNRYLGESFHATQSDGSQASFTFNGTAVYIFGAKRGNHGHYLVTVDNNQAQRFDGYAPTQSDGTDGVYQVPLFAQTGLSDGMHTVVLTNDIGTDTTRPYVDIDFITWTSNDVAGTSNITLDDGAFTYTTPGAAWTTSSSYMVDYYNKTEHITNVAGAAASLTFEGSGIYLYGGTLNDHGTFNVQIDDHSPVGLNGSTKDYHPRVLLYYADGLGAGKHKLQVTNTQGGGFLDIDYVDVVQSKSSEASQANPGGKAKTPIIAGVTCGVIIVAAWAIAAVWYFMKRRKNRSQGADIITAEAKPYEVPPAGYGPASGGPGWDGHSLRAQEPWANDPAFIGGASFSPTNTNTNTGTGIATNGHMPNQALSNGGTGSGSYPMSMYPPSSVSGSGPGSSTGAPSSYGAPTSTYGAPTMTTRPSMQHQPLSSLTQASESDAHVNEMAQPPNIKGRAPVVQQTGPRGELTEEQLRQSRMMVPERPQDWGPVEDPSETEFAGTLPPDYNQATEPFKPRQPHAQV